MNSLNPLVNEFAKNNAKVTVVIGDYIGKISPIEEWIKWLSYEPDFMKEKIGQINNQSVSETKNDELDYILVNRKRIYYAILFKKYKDGKCNQYEYNEIVNYMKKEDINDLMIDKLSENELKVAKEKIEKLKNLDYEELKKIIDEIKDVKEYNNLSMLDAYVIHHINKIKINQANKNLDDEINAALEENRRREIKTMRRLKKLYP